MKAKIYEYFLNDDFKTKIINCAYKALEQVDNPVRFNNFCLAYRELIDQFIDEKCDEREIKKCDWFIEQNSQRGSDWISRFDKIRYATTLGFSEETLDKLYFDMETIKDLKELYNILSAFVHIRERTYNISINEVLDQVKSVEDTVYSFLCDYDNIRDVIEQSVITPVSDDLMEASISIKQKMKDLKLFQ